jgi:hypothetical protein
MVEERTKRNGETEKEQGQSLSREVEVRKKRDRRGHIASVVSIICFCLPGTLMLLWFLLCWYHETQNPGEGIAFFGIIMGIVGGTVLTGISTAFGTALALYAVLTTEWRRGKAGLVLNLLLLLPCCACILLALWWRF